MKRQSAVGRAGLRITSGAFRRRLLGSLLGLAATMAGAQHSARAEDPGATERKAAAQVLFDEAMAARKRGEPAAACQKLEESLRLDPTAGTKFYFAECLEQTNKLASAWTLYTEVADTMAATDQKERETYARDRAAAILPKLTRIAIVVPAAMRVPGLTVRRNQVIVGEAQWGVAVPVDPGEHAVVAEAPGKVPFFKRITVSKPAESVEVEVGPWPVLAPPPPTATLAVAAPPAPNREIPGLPGMRIAGMGMASVGLVGLAAAGALGGLALSKRDASNAGPCDAHDVCTPEGRVLRAEAILAADVSTGLFVGAGLITAAGAMFMIFPSLQSPRATARVRPAGAGLAVTW